MGCCVDGRRHERDCLIDAQLLLAHERMPGVEVECVADRAGDPHSCAAALATVDHQHSREDEYSYVLEGRMGARLGDDVVYAEAGDLVFKPRNQWHTFWNAGDRPCRILEIISPGGFEHCFDEMAAAMASPNFDPQQMAEGAARYGIELQPESIPALCAEHGLTHPMLQASH